MGDSVNIPGVILAGGQGQRMGGQDKALLRLGGQTLLDRAIGRLGPQCSGLAVNANGDAGRFGRLDLPVLPDSAAGQLGPLAGILAAMDWAAGLGAGRVVTIAVDTPFIPLNLVDRLAAEGAAGVAMAASEMPGSDRHLQPVCALWPVALREDLRTSLAEGERKVRKWAQPHGLEPVLFADQGVDPFFNINTPQDLRQARALLRGDQYFRMK
ncbi:MAG: molybdenum cofactor guanylyltransferase MobA [Rhodobacteraceae bacterium]|nr:molybdenum cofactor guanylyltransferase MobA [Paracoccaceae bacterium]